MKAQSWINCNPEIKTYVNVITESLKELLVDDLTGVYLYGSLSTGSYYFPKSDIDLLIVVEKKLTPEKRKSLSELFAHLSEERPGYGNIEVVVITKNTAQNFAYPVPYEIQYNTGLHIKIVNSALDFAENKTDIDLVPALVGTSKRGIKLYGMDIPSVFGDVPWSYFINGILDDFNWIVEDENILETPFYGVLNICRIIQTVLEKVTTIITKDEGGKWALENLPEKYTPIIQQALNAYHSETNVRTETERKQGGMTWNKKSLLEFRDYAREKMKNLLKEQTS